MLYAISGVKGKHLTGGRGMDALEMTLLFDYYGDLLTERQRQCFDLRYNQDLSLGEIAQELGVSRQGVYDNLSRAETLLRNMEEKTGCVRRDLNCRRVVETIRTVAYKLLSSSDPQTVILATDILTAADSLKE